MLARGCATKNHYKFQKSLGDSLKMQQNSWTPPPPPPINAPTNIPNYLVPAILTTVFCCLPAGIVAIVYAAQVNGKVAAGDIQGALASSKNARTWMFVSLGIGLAIMIFYVVMMIVGGTLSALSGASGR
jgi:predicted secreted protein